MLNGCVFTDIVVEAICDVMSCEQMPPFYFRAFMHGTVL